MSDEASPIPARFWWLKRLSVAGAVALVALVALRWCWGYEMNRRLEAAVAAIEAKGESIRFDDMKRPAVPDADNKAYYLQQALANWPRVGGLLITDTDWYGEPEQFDDPITDNAAYLKQCEAVFDLLRQAEAAPEVDWGVHIVRPPILTLLPHLGAMRGLTRLVDDAASRAHKVGEHRLALRLVDLQLSTAEAVNTSMPTLIGHLVGISMRAMAAKRLREMLPTLPPPVVAEGGGATDLADRLIARLLEGDDQRRRLAQAMMGERWTVHHTAMGLVTGQIHASQLWGGGSSGGSGWTTRALIGPYFQRDALFSLDVMTAYQQAAEQASTWPEFKRQLQVVEPALARLDDHGWLHPISAILLPAYDAATKTHYAVLCRQRMAAIALAIRQYEADFGQRPAALDDLVPAYLAAVPRDPFAGDGRAIDYLRAGVIPMQLVSSWNKQTASIPGASAVAVLYSVGEDGVDDGGQLLLDSDYTLSTGNEAGWEGFDMVLPLDPLPAPILSAAPSSGERVDDQAQPGD